MAKRRTDDYEDSEEYYELKRAVGRRIRTIQSTGSSRANNAQICRRFHR